MFHHATHRNPYIIWPWPLAKRYLAFNNFNPIRRISRNGDISQMGVSKNRGTPKWMENPWKTLLEWMILGVMNLHHCFMSCVPCDELLPVRFEICPLVWYQHLRQLQWKTLRRITGCSVSVVCGSGSLG